MNHQNKTVVGLALYILKRLRIAVINNYDLERVEKDVASDEVPNHLLFGINYLRALGHKVKTFSIKDNFKEKKTFKGFLFRSLTHIENLELQQKVLRKKDEFDLILGLCGGVTEWLYFQIFLKKINIKILTIYHHPLSNGRIDFLRNFFRKQIYKKQKLILCLSHKTALSYNKILNRNVAQSIPWGVDYNFYRRMILIPQNLNNQNIILSCGRTGRDFEILSKACQMVGVKAKIICSSDESTALETENELVSIERTHYSPEKKENTYRQMANLMPSVMAIAIPLKKQSSLAGLTSLMDCLGFGKPVIMTRNPCIDIDVEKIGIGHLVEPNDTDAWAKAIDWHRCNTSESLSMGRRARSLGEKLSSESFAENLNDIILNFYKK